MVPSVGTRGIFNFAEPYHSLVNEDQEFTVSSVRLLPELEASGEQPFETIYVPVGETESVYLEDLKNNIAIITFRTDGGEYFYVPANKILTDAKQTGIKYIEKTAIITLGYLPKDINLSILEQVLNDNVYDILGVQPNIKIIDTSSVIYVDKIKHETLTAARKNIVKIDKSYRTRYVELLELYNKQQQLIKNIEEIYTKNGIGG